MSERVAKGQLDVKAMRDKALNAVAASEDLLGKLAQLNNKDNLKVVRQPGEISDDAVARVATSPIARGATVARKFMEPMFGEIAIGSYVKRLTAEAAAVGKGDMSGLESMLVTQATTLDAIFNNMASSASNATHLPTLELLLRTALKAQAQCRSTVEAIAEIRNPRQIAFIKQQNNARGHQQVNNGVPAEPNARAHEQKEPNGQSNKLLGGESDGTALDPRTASPSVRGDQAVEAVGTVHRTDVRRRKSRRVE